MHTNKNKELLPYYKYAMSNVSYTKDTGVVVWSKRKSETLKKEC